MSASCNHAGTIWCSGEDSNLQRPLSRNRGYNPARSTVSAAATIKSAFALRATADSPRSATTRVYLAEAHVNCIGRRLEEGEGIEPLALRATPVFETGCRPFSGTLLIEDDEPSSDSICLLLVFLFSNLVYLAKAKVNYIGEGWWRRRDSNSRPSGYEPDALPLRYSATFPHGGGPTRTRTSNS